MSARGVLASRFRKLAAQFPYLPRALRLVFAAAPRYASLWLVLLVVQGLLPIATVYLTRSLVNALVAAMRSASPLAESRHALVLIGVMAFLLLVSEAARVFAAWIRTAQAELVQDEINRLIHRKSVEVDLAFYDSAEFFDHLHRARSEAGYRPVALVENLGSILQNAVTLISMLCVLAPFGIWLSAALLLSTLPALYVVLRHALDQHNWRLRTTADERRTWYYDWLLTAVESAAEIRLFGLGGHFQSAFQTLRARLRSERLHLAAGQGVAELLAGIFALATAGAALAWMAWRALRHEVTLGDLAMFYQAFQQGMHLSRSLLENVGQLYANTLFLGNLFEFLALEPKVLTPLHPVALPAPARSIRFRNVTFRYPGVERRALGGLDLEIPAGRITAVVGSNGAGKSTLLKLLCRFYDPDDGSVEIDGVDLRTFDLAALRNSVTVLFQQPVHYNATVAQNVAWGDVAAPPDADAVKAAVELAGAVEIVERLPNGYAQLLGRWFENGTELSAGEWQRIALARAFLRPAPIIVLDEPTSSMDPWAEADWLNRFRRLAAGRTALVITHRFTTARIADTVCVMAGGRIVESGPHSALIAAAGPYAQGWAAQTAEAGPTSRDPLA
jgi:ATP-binding cassette subfamily B protein